MYHWQLTVYFRLQDAIDDDEDLAGSDVDVPGSKGYVDLPLGKKMKPAMKKVDYSWANRECSLHVTIYTLRSTCRVAANLSIHIDCVSDPDIVDAALADTFIGLPMLKYVDLFMRPHRTS